MDRLGWTVGKVFVAYGLYFGVRSNSLEIMERIVSLLPPGTREVKPRKVETIFSFLYGGEPRERSIQRFNIVFRNNDRIARAVGEVEMLLDVLRDDIEICVGEMASAQFFIHAGVVGWKDRAIVIPGRSHSGKSTLVREFIKAGAVLYSDEFAVIDRHGRVRPYPRLLNIRDSRGRSRRVRPEEIGAVVGTRPLPTGLVLFSAYRRHAAWNPRTVAGGKAILKIMSNSLAVRRHPDKLLALAKHIVSSAPVVSSARGEARHVVDWCINHF